MSREKVELIVRIRPILKNEINEILVEKLAYNKLKVRKEFCQNTLCFDKVYGANESNQDIFEYVRPNLTQVCSGLLNATIFAYGQTGAGKTHTMASDGRDTGLMHRSLQLLFAHIQHHEHNTEYELMCTFYEIYNEKIYDLFCEDEKAQPALVREQIKELPNGEVVVDGLQEVVLSGYSAAAEVLRAGLTLRSTDCTTSNDLSSRSHCVLNLLLMQRPLCAPATCITLSKVRLVDLAGSEKFDKSCSDSLQNRQRVNELICINKSLTALGHCIHSLAEGSRHVPYRNSKITRILKDSIMGNSRIMMFICLSPGVSNANETLSSLQFAERIKKVRLEVKQPLHPSSQNPRLDHLQKELEAERTRRMYLEHQISQLSSEQQPAEVEASGQLDHYKDVNRELESSLEQLLLYSCKNCDAQDILTEFGANPRITDTYVRLSQGRQATHSPTHSHSPTPTRYSPTQLPHSPYQSPTQTQAPQSETYFGKKTCSLSALDSPSSLTKPQVKRCYSPAQLEDESIHLDYDELEKQLQTHYHKYLHLNIDNDYVHQDSFNPTLPHSHHINNHSNSILDPALTISDPSQAPFKSEIFTDKCKNDFKNKECYNSLSTCILNESTTNSSESSRPSNRTDFIEPLNEIYSKIHSEIMSIKELILRKHDKVSIPYHYVQKQHPILSDITYTKENNASLNCTPASECLNYKNKMKETVDEIRNLSNKIENRRQHNTTTNDFTGILNGLDGLATQLSQEVSFNNTSFRMETDERFNLLNI